MGMVEPTEEIAMGEQREAMDSGGEDKTQPPRSAIVSTRRAGSSWNRSSSAWSVGVKDSQKVGRRLAKDLAAANPAHDSATKGGLMTNGDSQSLAMEPLVHVDIRKEKGIFQVKGTVETVVDPDTLFGIITNFDQNARVFRNVDKVEVVNRGDEKIVTQLLHWKFLMWSGQYDVKMKMKSHPESRSISYDLEQPGFLKVFNGSWTVEPLVSEGTSPASKLILNQRALPSFFPPGVLGSYATRIMSSQVNNLLIDVAREASQVHGSVAIAL